MNAITPEGRDEFVGSAIEQAADISDVSIRLGVLKVLAFCAPSPRLRADALKEAVEVAGTLGDLGTRVDELKSVAEHLFFDAYLASLLDLIDESNRKLYSDNALFLLHFSEELYNSLMLGISYLREGKEPGIIADRAEIVLDYDSLAEAQHLLRNLRLHELSKLRHLPDHPTRYWPGRPPGRPKPGAEEALFAFIREVYGPYFQAGHREGLRAYIYKHDRPLYDAIRAYERGAGGRDLPSDIGMPARPEIVRQRIQKAAAEGLETLSQPERRSVLGKIRRNEKSRPKPT